MDSKDILARAGDHLSVGRAFGAPVERDGATVVPVAFVAGGGGAGRGGADEGGKGEGGGFGGVVYPLGAYVLREGKVRFVPAVDVTRMVSGVLLLLRLAVKGRKKVVVVRRGPRGRAGATSRGS